MATCNDCAYYVTDEDENGNVTDFHSAKGKESGFCAIDLFNLILRLGTYDGETEYSCFEELIADEKNAGVLAINADDIKRIAYVAYNLGFERGKKSED